MFPSQIQDLTSEVLIAKMRLQFWRETLDKIYSDNVPRQPVAMELHRVSWLCSQAFYYSLFCPRAASNCNK